MGDLINFQTSPRREHLHRQSALLLPQQDATATILLFTGIRYERMAEAEPAPAQETPGPKKPRGRRRA